MAVLRPLKVVIENYPEGQTEELEAVNQPGGSVGAGSRKVRFARELCVERDDFMENPPKKFFRLSPGKEVRLRYAYFVTCREAVKNAAGEVVELRCTYDPATRGGNTPPDGRKVQATLHWVSAADAVPAEVRLYNPLFTRARSRRRRLRRRPQPELARGAGRRARSSRRWPPADNADGAVQFERQGYFCRDRGLQARPPGVQPHGRPARHLGQGVGRRQGLTRSDPKATQDNRLKLAECSTSALGDERHSPAASTLSRLLANAALHAGSCGRVALGRLCRADLLPGWRCAERQPAVPVRTRSQGIPTVVPLMALSADPCP